MPDHILGTENRKVNKAKLLPSSFKEVERYKG